jgi:hypothetical protein
MGSVGSTITAISASVIGLAALAVIFSKNSNTGSVLTSAGQAYGSIIGAAVAPVSGGAGGSSDQSSFNL